MSNHLVQALTRPLARGIGLPGHVSWVVESGVRDGSFARFALATARLEEGGFIQVGVVDLEGAAVMTAAGDQESPDVPELAMTGFKAAPSRYPRTFYRLNPPGGYFGGEMRALVGDRYVVSARGERLMMETIADQVSQVVRELERGAAPH